MIASQMRIPGTGEGVTGTGQEVVNRRKAGSLRSSVNREQPLSHR